MNVLVLVLTLVPVPVLVLGLELILLLVIVPLHAIKDLYLCLETCEWDCDERLVLIF